MKTSINYSNRKLSIKSRRYRLFYTVCEYFADTLHEGKKFSLKPHAFFSPISAGSGMELFLKLSKFWPAYGISQPWNKEKIAILVYVQSWQKMPGTEYIMGFQVNIFLLGISNLPLLLNQSCDCHWWKAPFLYAMLIPIGTILTVKKYIRVQLSHGGGGLANIFCR